MDNVEREQRLGALTEKGKERFENRKRALSIKIAVLTSDISTIANNIDFYSNDAVSLEELRLEFVDSISRYEALCNEYMKFLRRTNTLESEVEAERLKTETNEFTVKFENDLRKIQRLILTRNQETEREETRSKCSKRTDSSKGSRNSTMSSVVAKAKAKAEAARIRAKFAEQESKLLKERQLLQEKQTTETARAERIKADLEADLDLLAFKKEAAANEAEVDALQSECGENISQILPMQPPFDPKERTFAYVEQVSQLSNHVVENSAPTRLDPTALPFEPKAKTTIVTNNHEENCNNLFERTMTTEFSRFLLKKDLLFTSFHTFNDQAEFYPSWKDSFQSIVKDLDAEPREEIDLLLKWTGPQSQLHVRSLKAANGSDPAKALKLIWNRFDERYGSPELIDSALKDKLNNFPRISIKECKKLYELSDILSEIASVKLNGNYATMFSYFDSSIGISPIVAKLPYQLQERWTRTSVNYNNTHKCVYPPFEVFLEFIQEQSRIKNNPSFMYEAVSNNTPTKQKKPIPDRGKLSEIRTRKTDFTETNNPMSKCPIHGTHHSLNDCKAFKSKPLNERRRFLRQNKICFKCCSSTSHVYRNCTNTVICYECGKLDHPSALHIKIKQDMKPESPPNHGGEHKKQQSQTEQVLLKQNALRFVLTNSKESLVQR